MFINFADLTPILKFDRFYLYITFLTKKLIYVLNDMIYDLITKKGQHR